MTAKAREESIVYAIPIAAFKPFVAQNAEVLNFLLESFAANSKNSLDKENPGKLMSDNVMHADGQSDTLYFPWIFFIKRVFRIRCKTFQQEV